MVSKSMGRSCLALLLLLLLFTPIRSVRAQAPDSPPRAAGIDAILVADTRTGPEGTVPNLHLLESLFLNAQKLGYDVSITMLEDDRATPGGMISAIRRLDPRRMRERTLFFYYAGHGGTDPGSGHFLRTPWGDLSRSVLLAEIRARSARLSLIFTDCCSTRTKSKVALPGFPVPPERRAFENLFFQHVGVVDMNASSCHPEKGIYQAAFYSPFGGIFTGSFISMFNPAQGRPREAAPVAPGEPNEEGHWRRFGTDRSILHDRNKDGFLDWSEAREYLDSAVSSGFYDLRADASSERTLQIVNPADLRLLESQVSQDPQVFGPLAVRSDRDVVEVSAFRPGHASRRPRFGATFTERYERGGAYLEITNVEARSPATKVSVWNGARKSKSPTTMVVGDTVLWANGVRIRSIRDLLKVLDTVPEGGEFNIIGYDASTGRRSKYEATALLDSYAE